MANPPVVYDSARTEMLSFVPDSARSILDVGCSTGGFGRQLRASREGVLLWGIDPTPHPSQYPQPYDERIAGSFPHDVPARTTFDCVVLNDVLEHLIDPWEALIVTRSILAIDGCVVASIPNVRHVQITKQLVLHGRFDYQDSGILDRTHLRFFTRASIMELFEGSGFQVEQLAPLRVSQRGSLATVNRWSRGWLTDFLAEQFAVVARPRDESSISRGT